MFGKDGIDIVWNFISNDNDDNQKIYQECGIKQAFLRLFHYAYID